MRTLFVSGSDTNVGKTWVVGAIAQHLSTEGATVQVVKPIESGVCGGAESDVAQVLEGCSGGLVKGYTLRSYSKPIAPVAAAEYEGKDLDFSEIESSITSLPADVDWRIIEGAGSLATPLSNDGRDWLDLAVILKVQALILVVEDRVGAIGQARLVYEYANSKDLNCGVWLNEIEPQESLGKTGTLNGIQNLKIPIWGMTQSGQLDLCFAERGWL